MKNKLRISIGISAYNEDKNIKNVLNDILSQKQKDWKLSEILVYCDGCEDNTAKISRDLKSRFSKTREFNKRKGKVFRINQILEVFKGDILVIFDADIRLKDKKVINNLISEFKKYPDTMLVGGNSQAYSPKSFFERAIYTSYQVYYKSRETIKNGQNVFACTGACLALKKGFAKKISIPKEILVDDTFIYFSCLSMGYKFRYARRAIVRYKLASNLSDYLRQMLRSHPESINLSHEKYFGDLIKQEYKRPLGFYFKSIFKVFLSNPLGTIYIIILKILAQPLFKIFSKNYKLNWWTAVTTK